MPLLNCKVVKTYCLLSAAGNNDNDDNDKKIIFTIKYTTLNVPDVTLLTRDNQKLSKLSKGSERSVYWNE